MKVSVTVAKGAQELVERSLDFTSSRSLVLRVRYLIVISCFSRRDSWEDVDFVKISLVQFQAGGEMIFGHGVLETGSEKIISS